MPFPNQIITCRALAHIFEQLLGSDAPLSVLDISLHLQPDRLRRTLMEKVKQLEQDGTTILFGYGLCGRALEGVVSQKSTLILPMIDDCVGMLLGSRERHRQMLHDNPGSFFLEPHWLDTEMNIFEQINRGLEHIPQKRRRELLKIGLKHYDRLVLLADSETKGCASERCIHWARDYDLEFEQITRRLDLINRLLNGSWDETEFIVAPPGTPIPFF